MKKTNKQKDKKNYGALHKLKKNTLYVMKLDKHHLPYKDYYENLLGVEDRSNCPLLCLGEIKNQRNHYIFVSKEGKIVLGLHGYIFDSYEDN